MIIITTTTKTTTTESGLIQRRISGGLISEHTPPPVKGSWCRRTWKHRDLSSWNPHAIFLKNVIGSPRMTEPSDRCGRHTQAHILISGSLPGAPRRIHPPSATPASALMIDITECCMTFAQSGRQRSSRMEDVATTPSL